MLQLLSSDGALKLLIVVAHVSRAAIWTLANQLQQARVKLILAPLNPKRKNQNFRKLFLQGQLRS